MTKDQNPDGEPKSIVAPIPLNLYEWRFVRNPNEPADDSHRQPASGRQIQRTLGKHSEPQVQEEIAGVFHGVITFV